MIRTIELLLVAVLCAPTMVYSQTVYAQTKSQRSESFTDRNGSFAGSSSSRGNSTTFTDRNGHFDGTAIRNSDGTTSFYDKSGHFSGSRSNATQPR